MNFWLLSSFVSSKPAEVIKGKVYAAAGVSVHLCACPATSCPNSATFYPKLEVSRIPPGLQERDQRWLVGTPCTQLPTEVPVSERPPSASCTQSCCKLAGKRASSRKAQEHSPPKIKKNRKKLSPLVC